MRGLRGFVRFTSCALLLVTSSRDASAQLLVASAAGQQPVEHAELAYALGDGPPVTWLSLRVKRGPVALLAALPEGARADSALDAWLQALETTASPRVLLPRDVTDCGGATTFVDVTWPRAEGAAPDELALDSPEDVASALAAQGLTLAGELPTAPAYVLWSWPHLDSARTTRTLRVRGGAAPLAFAPGSPFPVLVSAVTRGAMAFAAEVEGSVLDVTFVAGERKRSDYRARVGSWLAGHLEPILETRSRSLLFDWSIHGDLVSVAPLTRSYALRAAVELPNLDAEACSRWLSLLRTEPSSESPACADAEDAALALRAADPELATLQRFIVSGALPVTPDSLAGGGQPRPPIVRAKDLDDSACVITQQPPLVIEPLPPGGGGGGEPPRGGGQVVEVEDTVVVEHHDSVEIDCGGSPGPEPSDSYYSDDGSCSSDTSSSSDRSEVDCSGDTSTSSDPSGEADCSSDTSSSSSDDASCDGGPGDDYGEDSGYDGDTCTGSAAPARATQKSQAGLVSGTRRVGPQRLKTSLWSVAFAALVLPIRRRKRGRSAAG